jgi:hypothetical protein
LENEHLELRLTRRGAAFVPGSESAASPEETVDDRDAVVWLIRRAEVAPLTARILWGRACGIDNDALRVRLGLTRTQPWDHWRRGLAAVAASLDNDQAIHAA